MWFMQLVATKFMVVYLVKLYGLGKVLLDFPYICIYTVKMS